MLIESNRWQQANGLDLPIRIGIASGPVVGGVIGRQRILFDLWGDTVNTAARMQATGIPGRVQISESARKRISQGPHQFESRVVEVKGLGSLTTFCSWDRPKGLEVIAPLVPDAAGAEEAFHPGLELLLEGGVSVAREADEGHRQVAGGPALRLLEVREERGLVAHGRGRAIRVPRSRARSRRASE